VTVERFLEKEEAEEKKNLDDPALHIIAHIGLDYNKMQHTTRGMIADTRME
jgi:hypothetical protein